MSSPCHIELTLSEKEEPVKKEVGCLVILLIFDCGHFFLFFLLTMNMLQPETQLAPRTKKNQA